MQSNTKNQNDVGTPRVPVLDEQMCQLMPTTPARARLLLKQGKASAYHNKLGIFCIILHEEKEPNNQPLVLGIDPGSKFEGWSVVGTKYTVLNGMSEAPTWVKGNVKTRKEMRRGRRFRNCPRRPCRSANRARSELPPSTKSRWQAKLGIAKQLRKIMPIGTVVIEDVKAETRKNAKRWNTNFSPLEVGKKWFYAELRNLGLALMTENGYKTKALRDEYNLHKCKQKDKTVFYSHAVDAWCLAASQTGAERPSWRGLYYWTPIQLHRRRLHAFQPAEGGVRKSYGGTISMGLTRGTLVRHVQYGLTYIGGTSKGKLSLHCLSNGNRLTTNASVEDLDLLSTIHWRTLLITIQKSGVSAHAIETRR